MYWIEGLARTPNGFVLETLHEDGLRTQESLAGLGDKLFKGKTSRTRITTTFQRWSIASALPFWEALSIEQYGPRAGHQIFKVIHEDTEFLIPASVLIAAAIRPIKHIHPYLFRPHGLELFSVPLLEQSRPTIRLFAPAHHFGGGECMVTPGLLASYSWMHCFPSARAMWDSVYQAACGSRLDIALPKASMDTVLHSIAWNGVRLVTDMVITAFHAEDAPFEFASDHARKIIYHHSAAIDWAYAHSDKEALPRRNGTWALSDEEWKLLCPRIQKGRTVKHDLRRIIDLILAKLGTQTAWRKLDYQELNFSIVQATYQRMNKDGRWSAIEKILKTSRRI